MISLSIHTSKEIGKRVWNTYNIIDSNYGTVGAMSIDIYSDHAYIQRLDIDNPFQNKGFGTAAIRSIACEVQKPVYISPDNPDAARLYARLGEMVADIYEYDEGYGVFKIA